MVLERSNDSSSALESISSLSKLDASCSRSISRRLSSEERIVVIEETELDEDGVLDGEEIVDETLTRSSKRGGAFLIGLYFSGALLRFFDFLGAGALASFSLL